MNKQLIITLFILAGVALGALWFVSPFSEQTGGQAIAAEAESEPAKDANALPAEPWSQRCDKPAEGEEETAATTHCEIVQRLFVQETGKRFAEFAIGYPEDAGGDARGVIILPLGVLLEPGVKMQVDEGRVYQFGFRYCGAGGCVAVIKLSSGIIDEMKKGNAAAVQFMSAKGQTINLPITLKGFSKAIATLKE